jgi:hypothetical protein
MDNHVEKGDVANIQRCGIAECLTQVAMHFGLGSKVEFLEEFRADGDAACCSDLPQSIVGLMGVIQMFVVVVLVACLVSDLICEAPDRSNLPLLLQSFSNGPSPIRGPGAVMFSLFCVALRDMAMVGE